VYQLLSEKKKPISQGQARLIEKTQKGENSILTIVENKLGEQHSDDLRREERSAGDTNTKEVGGKNVTFSTKGSQHVLSSALTDGLEE